MYIYEFETIKEIEREEIYCMNRMERKEKGEER